MANRDDIASYLGSRLIVLDAIGDEEWEEADKYTRAAMVMLGLDRDAEPLTRGKVLAVQRFALTLFKAFPDGVPEGVRYETQHRVDVEVKT